METILKNNLTEELQQAFCPFGYLDIERAAIVMNEAGYTNDDLVEHIEDYCSDVGSELKDIDPVYSAYNFIFQSVRTEIEEKTGKDVLNDTKGQIEVYGNYLCTAFDYSKEAKEEFLEIIKEIPEGDRSKALTWVIEELG